jgi:hypothetical protein
MNLLNKKDVKEIPSSSSKIDEFLASLEFSDIITKFVQDYSLSESPADKVKAEDTKRWKLVKILGEVLRGELSPDSFNNSIQEKLNLSVEKATVISKEIDQRIFSRFKMELEEIYKEKKGGRMSSTSRALPRIHPEKTVIIEKKDDSYREPIE